MQRNRHPQKSNWNVEENSLMLQLKEIQSPSTCESIDFTSELCHEKAVFLASNVPTYYTTLPHNLIGKTYRIDHFLIEWIFLIQVCNEKTIFSLLNNLNDIIYGHVRECVTLSIIFWNNMFIRFGSKLL